MPFRKILGQPTAVSTLELALKSRRVPHAYRFEGPDGVGKEMAALALAQSLLCEKPKEGLACLDCSACHRVATRSDVAPHLPLHPDLVFVGRGLYSAATLGTSSVELASIGIEQVRRIILARAGFAPHEGRALVFVVRAAEELSLSAANALLKTLEEPRPGVHFILLTSQPRRLLDTIRSRTLVVRFGALPDACLREILSGHGASHSVIPSAQGSAALALELSNPDSLASREAFVKSMDRAIAAPDYASALKAFDLKQADRESLKNQLGWLAAQYARRAREAATDDPREAELLAQRYALIAEALRDLGRNAQPALLAESLLYRLRQQVVI